MKKYLKHVLPMLLIVGIIFALVFWASPVKAGKNTSIQEKSASDSDGSYTTKEEVIYANLYNNGSTNKIYVVNIFDVNKASIIKDFGDYSNVINLTSTDTITKENNMVSFYADTGRFYYQGYTNSTELPWLINIEYYLDAKAINAEDLSGQSGQLQISISTKENPFVKSDFFNNFMLQISLTLDTNKCFNIQAPEAIIANAGSNKVLTYTVLPGDEGNISLTTDITDFSMEGISINGINYNMAIDLGEINTTEFTDQLKELSDAIAKLDDGVKELSTGTSELYDGTAQMYDGLGKMTNSFSKLTDGSKELSEGADELATGSKELLDGMDELYLGIEELYDNTHAIVDGARDLANGLATLSAQNSTLSSGAQAMADAILQMANAQLSASLGASAPTLTWSNYATELGNILGVTDAMRDATKAQISSQSGLTGNELETLIYLASQESSAARDPNGAITAAATTLQTVNAASNAGGSIYEAQAALIAAGGNPLAVTNVINVLNQLVADQSGGLLTPDQVTAEQRFAAYDNTASQFTAAGVSAENTALIIVMACNDVAANSTDFNTALTNATATISLAGNVQTATAAVAAGTTTTANNAFLTNMVLVNSSTQLLAIQNLLTALMGAESFVNGLTQYTSGVSSLASGASSLHSGLAFYRSGLADLYEGSEELRNGTESFYNGVVEFNDGASSLYEGVREFEVNLKKMYVSYKELKDGTSDLNDGIQELSEGTGEMRAETANMDQKMQKEIDKKIDEMLAKYSGSDFAFQSFLSDENQNVAAVQFVIKTDGIEAAPEPTAEIPAEPELTFWQRFLNLFDL